MCRFFFAELQLYNYLSNRLADSLDNVVTDLAQNFSIFSGGDLGRVKEEFEKASLREGETEDGEEVLGDDGDTDREKDNYRSRGSEVENAGGHKRVMSVGKDRLYRAVGVISRGSEQTKKSGKDGIEAITSVVDASLARTASALNSAKTLQHEVEASQLMQKSRATDSSFEESPEKVNAPSKPASQERERLRSREWIDEREASILQKLSPERVRDISRSYRQANDLSACIYVLLS